MRKSSPTHFIRKLPAPIREPPPRRSVQRTLSSQFRQQIHVLEHSFTRFTKEHIVTAAVRAVAVAHESVEVHLNEDQEVTKSRWICTRKL